MSVATESGALDFRLLYDDSLHGLLTLAGLDGGMRFDPAKDMLYAVNSTTDQLIGFDTSAKVQRFAIPLGRNFASGSQYASGMMAVGAGKAFISDDAGILVMDIPQPTGQAAQFKISGYYGFARRGTAGTVRIRLGSGGIPCCQLQRHNFDHQFRCSRDAARQLRLRRRRQRLYRTAYHPQHRRHPDDHRQRHFQCRIDGATHRPRGARARCLAHSSHRSPRARL
jgi:hypothetical protein